MGRRDHGTGSIFEDRERGGWVVLVSTPSGRRKARTKTRKAALARLDEMRADLARHGDLPSGSATVAQLLDEWERLVLGARGHTETTLISYRWALKVLRRELGTRRLRTLAPEDVEAAFADLARRGMTRASLQKLRQVLGQALAFGERRRYVNSNPARVAELPAAARRQAPGRSLTVDQARTLLDALDQDRLGALFAVELMLGLRPGEAAGLAWRDVDLDQHALHVRSSLKWIAGRPVVDERLKTGRSRRSLAIPAPLETRLRAHRARQSADRLAAGDAWHNAHDLVFTNVLGSPLDPANVRRTLARITTDAGLGRWHPHELRHSAASLLSAAGVPIERVADTLGHATTYVTDQVYRHLTMPIVDDAAAPIEAMFARGDP
jgi:integrase